MQKKKQTKIRESFCWSILCVIETFTHNILTMEIDLWIYQVEWHSEESYA